MVNRYFWLGIPCDHQLYLGYQSGLRCTGDRSLYPNVMAGF
ncbi:Uncharacterised protein [Vibrio cholerae]|nr:Uncharacterised protein [Vibrio cholerae]